MKQTQTILTNQSDFLFKLQQTFCQNTLVFDGQELFTNANTEKCKRVRFPEIRNEYLDNELRGFVQHLVMDDHLAPSTITTYVGCTLRMVVLFMNDCHPDKKSITDIGFEMLYNEYVEYLSDRGIQLTTDSIIRVNQSMGTTIYTVKSDYLYAIAKFYKFVYSVKFPDNRKEYDKDVWDIRNLGIPVSIAVSRKRYTLNFTCIKQLWLRQIAKEYSYYRLQNKCFSTVIDDIKALRLFSEFLSKQRPDIVDLLSLDRDTMEEYFAFLNGKGFQTTTYNHRVSELRTFFFVGNMLDLEGIPEKSLIYRSDFKRIVHKLPKYFTESELKQMNSHIGELPPQIGRLFFVLENCGMRVSDILSTPIEINGKPCLSKNQNGEYTLTYYMPKTHKHNTIPTSNVVGLVLEEAIRDSKSQFGDDCKYIFASSKNRPISVEAFSLAMNKMSADNKLVKDDGSPLRIKGHTFRGTVATQYANCGISMDVIRMMLGQRKIGVLTHYVTIHDETMLQYMRPLIDECDHRIRSIGHDFEDIESVPEPALLPLPNGRCSKPVSSGICENANRCYTCRMFKPSLEYIEVYRKQLLDAENNIAVAELHGYDRVRELNETIRDNLQNIISMLEAPMQSK